MSNVEGARRAPHQRRGVGGAIVAVLATAGGLLATVQGSTAEAVTVPFTLQQVDTGNTGDCKAVADFDGNGYLDGAVGGAQLAWYAFGADPAAVPVRKVIATATVEFSTDCQAVDVDGDGDTDLVVPDSTELYWFANPGGAATGTWTRTRIGTPGNWSHDVEVGDVNADGLVDVLTRREGATDLWLQGSPSSWTRRQISSQSGEGSALGDVDGDGDLDVVAGATWLEHPADINAAWPAHPISAVNAGPIPVSNLNWGSVAVVDMDADGRNDIVYGPLEATGSKLAWYSPTNAAATTWAEHLISPSPINAGLHTLKVGDIDGDGRLDVLAARMHTYNPTSVSVWAQNADGSFTEQVLGTGGLHNPRLADFDADGDLDVFGANYVNSPGGVRLYRNGRTTAPPPVDSVAPSVPSGLVASGVSSSGFTLSWVASSDAVGVVGYDVTGAGSTRRVASTSVGFSGLSASTSYPVSVVALDAAGNRSAPGSLTVTTAAATDSTRPSVVSFSPVNGATGVSVGVRPQVTFSEPINPTTAGSGVSLVDQAGAAVPAAVSTSGAVVTVTPAGALPAGVVCRIRVGAGVADLAGNLVTAPAEASFTTASVPVSVDALLVSGSANRSGAVPLQGASFLRSVSIYVFDQPGDSTASRVEFWVDNPAMSGPPRQTEGAAPYDLAGGSVATANPFPLSGLSVGTHTITARRTRSTGTVVTTTATFTVTTTAPPVDSVAPSVPSGLVASGVSSSGFTLSWVASSDAVGVVGYDVTGAGSTRRVASTSVGFSGLSASTSYPVSVVALDAAGNRSAPGSLTVTTAAATDSTRPSVVSFSPVNGATGVSVGVRPQVTFSEPINPTTATGAITLATATGTSVAATVSVSGATATLTPSSALANGTGYTVRVGTGVADLAGNALAAPAEASFTTASVPVSVDALLVSGSANRSGAVPLQGASFLRSVSIYVFDQPGDSTASRVEFWVDNPAMSGPPRQTEGTAPYDLAGGSVATANPFPLSGLSVGTHTITARRTRSTGTVVTTTATFTVR